MNTDLDLAQATALGVVIQRPTMAAEVFAQVRVEDFDGHYQDVAHTLHSLRLSKTPIEQLSVVSEMTRRGTIGRAGGPAEIARIAGHGFGDPSYACDVIVRTSRLRRLWTMGTKTVQAVQALDVDPMPVARGVVEAAQAIVDGIEAEGDISTQSLGEFLDVEDAPYEWVIPGLLERGDRLVLTGSEGSGKSVLLRQLAVAAASGVHPFTHERMPAQRVLLVDCENGPVKLRRALRAMATVGQKRGTDPSLMMHVECVPAGLDLTQPEDEAWLVRMVSAIQPDLLITGPIYRLHASNPNDEEPARKVTRVLDRCRVAAHCALVTEAHAGHGYGGNERPVRPAGSSLWLRWPEFGYGLRPPKDYQPDERVMDLVPWRGDREERNWPTRLRAGGWWPWEAVQSHEWSPSDHAIA